MTLAALALVLMPKSHNLPTPGVVLNGAKHDIGASGPQAQRTALPEGYALIGRVGEGSGKNRFVGYGFSNGDPLYRNPAYPSRLYIYDADAFGGGYQLLVNVEKIGELTASHIPE